MFHLDPQQAVLEHVAQPPKAKLAPPRLSDLAAALADQPIAPTYSSAVVAGVAQVTETVLLIVTGVALFGSSGGDTLLSVVTTLGVVAVAQAFIGMLRLQGIAAYRLGLSQLWKAALGWTAAFALLGGLVLLYDSGHALSRPWIFSFWAAGLGVLTVYRMVLHQVVMHWTRQGKLKRRTVIVGGGKDAEALIESIQSSGRDDIDLLGLFDDRNDDR